MYVDEFFDKSLVKDQFELAMRMAEVTRSTSEWHRRMTSENLSQSGQLVNLAHMPTSTNRLRSKKQLTKVGELNTLTITLNLDAS